MQLFTLNFLVGNSVLSELVSLNMWLSFKKKGGNGIRLPLFHHDGIVTSRMVMKALRPSKLCFFFFLRSFHWLTYHEPILEKKGHHHPNLEKTNQAIATLAEVTPKCAIGSINYHYFHIIGDGKINPMVGDYIPIIRISVIKGGRFPIPNIRS